METLSSLAKGMINYTKRGVVWLMLLIFACANVNLAVSLCTIDECWLALLHMVCNAIMSMLHEADRAVHWRDQIILVKSG